MEAKRARLQKARRDAAYTQETFAQELHVDRGTVHRWEGGKSEPQPYIRPKIAKLLGITLWELSDLLTLDREESTALTSKGPELDSTPGDYERGSPRYSPNASPRGRPCLSSGYSSESAYLESVALNRTFEASNLGAKTLEQLESAIENFGLDYLHVPPSQTLKNAGDARRFVIEVLSHKHTFAQQQKLYSAAAWLSALIGHCSFDVGESFGVTDGHLTTALHLASEIDDRGLISWIRGTQALSAIFTNRPRAAIEYAQSGQSMAHERSIMNVRLLAQEARAHARLGDRKLAEKCMGAAETSFDGVDEPLTTSILSFDRPYLPYYAGTCHSWLGRSNLAASAHGRPLFCVTALPLTGL